MSTIVRGAKNAFRNTIRTGGVVVILALSIGLALVMLLSLKTVEARIATIKASIGNTVNISPAGYSGFSQVNNALTTSELAPVASLPHVTQLVETVSDRLTTIGSSTPSFGGQQGSGKTSTSSTTNQTSLASPVKLNFSSSSSGSASGSGGGGHFFIAGGGSLPSNFSLPITVLGTNDPTSVDGTAITITSGSAMSGSSDTNEALVSSAMASKNNLKAGSTFKAYNANITVAGIFSTSGSTNQGAENTVVFSLPTVQRLSGQAGEITSATAYVDSVTNMSAVVSEISSKLGSAADVTNSQTQAQSTIAPLQNIQTIASYSLIGALVAGSLIIFLTMLMIVRERRREIGVLKAIGASNAKITLQFISESLTLTIGGAIVGAIGGLLLSNPVLKLLVSSTSSSSTTGAGPGGAGGGGGRGFGGLAGGAARAFSGARTSIATLHTVVGYDVLLYGLAAAFIIAIVGSALPAFAIAKIRPAEVMRGE